jgi:hypothetical protein
MIRTLLTAALLTAAPMANAVTIVIVRPVIVIVRPSVTVAPVSRPSVTTPAAHVPESPVTRVVTPPVTPVVVPLPAYTPPRSTDSCASERRMRGDCYTM